MSSNRNGMPDPSAGAQPPAQTTENVVQEPKKALSEAEKFKALKASLPKKGPINVIATRAGFYKMMRKFEGDKFTIDGAHHFGSWMKLI